MLLQTKSMAEHYRSVFDQYIRAKGKTEAELREVVRWAMAKGKLEVTPEQLEEVHLAIMQQSMRLDSISDHTGRKVRLRHPARIKDGDGHQRTLWAHIDDATDEFLLISLRQRRRAIRADIVSLQADLDFINRRRAERGLRPIQMDLTDFSDIDDDEDEQLSEAGD